MKAFWFVEYVIFILEKDKQILKRRNRKGKGRGGEHTEYQAFIPFLYGCLWHFILLYTFNSIDAGLTIFPSLSYHGPIRHSNLFRIAFRLAFNIGSTQVIDNIIVEYWRVYVGRTQYQTQLWWLIIMCLVCGHSLQPDTLHKRKSRFSNLLFCDICSIFVLFPQQI